jgi:hypothetical protein
VTIRARSGSENRLYGSVTPGDLADALQAQYAINVDRRKIELSDPIHRLGTYTATADIGSGVTATFSVEVVAEAAGAHGKASRASAPAAGDDSGAAPQSETEAGAADEAAGETETSTPGSAEMEAEAEANPS